MSDIFFVYPGRKGEETHTQKLGEENKKIEALSAIFFSDTSNSLFFI